MLSGLDRNIAVDTEEERRQCSSCKDMAVNMEKENTVYKNEYGRDNSKGEMESLLPRKPTSEVVEPAFDIESTSITIGEDDNAGSIELTESKPKTEDVSNQKTTNYGSIATAPSEQTDAPTSTSNTPGTIQK